MACAILNIVVFANEFAVLMLVYYVSLVTGFIRPLTSPLVCVCEHAHMRNCLTELPYSLPCHLSTPYTSILVVFAANPLRRRCFVALVSVLAVWPNWKWM